MRNSEYWKERFAQLETSGNRIGKNTLRQVETFYAKAEKELTDKIELWYERLARNNDISMAEARKMLTSKELQEFHWTVEEYVKYGQENAISGAWMKELENASAKAHINRLEAIKLEIQQSVEKLYGNQLDAIDAGIRKVYTEGYYRTAFELQKGFGVGFEMAAINEGALSKVIKKPWAPDGMNFSDRIWRNKNMLLSELHGSLTRSILTGAAPDAAIKELSERMHVSKTAAGRLIMTESAFFQSAAQRDCFEELDVEKYEIVATLDNRTSHICQKMDKKVFDMKDFQPGTTAPPFHVYCRSTTAPYFDDWDEFGIAVSRAARYEGGKTYSVGNMSYEEWRSEIAEGSGSMMATSKGLREKKKTQRKYVAIANNIKSEITNYSSRPSKWSGNIEVKKEIKIAGVDADGAKDWSCNIFLLDDVDDGVVWHEMLHSCSGSYYDPSVYDKHGAIEEASVEFLKQQICAERSIPNVPSYETQVSVLREINRAFKYGTDLEFAKELFNVPLPERYQWLEDKVDSSLRVEKVSFEDYNDVMMYVRTLKGGIKYE